MKNLRDIIIAVLLFDYFGREVLMLVKKPQILKCLPAAVISISAIVGALVLFVLFLVKLLFF